MLTSNSLTSEFSFRFLPQLTIINREGKKIPINYTNGQTLFKAIDGTPAQELQGVCGGNMACGGCHVILPEKIFEKPEEDEEDTLQNSKGLTKTSRLSCNLNLDEKFEGAVLTMGPK